MQWNLRSKQRTEQELYQHVCSFADLNIQFPIIFDKLNHVAATYLSHGNFLIKTTVSSASVSKVYFRGTQCLSKKNYQAQVSFIVQDLASYTRQEFPVSREEQCKSQYIASAAQNIM